jgi:hypothetical protein
MLAQNAGGDFTVPDKNWSATIYGFASKCLLVGKPGTANWCANETCLKAGLTPSALFHQTNLTLPPLDPQSWILLIPIVSHVSECSTIRKAFALSRRDDNGAETSTSRRSSRPRFKESPLLAKVREKWGLASNEAKSEAVGVFPNAVRKLPFLPGRHLRRARLHRQGW